MSPKNAMTKASPNSTVEVNMTKMERCFFGWPGRHWRCALVSRSGRHDSRPRDSSGLIVILLILVWEEIAKIVVTFNVRAGVGSSGFWAQEFSDLADQGDRSGHQDSCSPG